MMNKLMALIGVLNIENTVLIVLIAMFAPLKPIFFGVMFLIFADNITGIWASYIRDKVPFKFFTWESWKHITSAKLGKTITKSLVYMLVILSAFTIGTVVLGIPDMYITKFFVGVICLREIKSLIENGEIILGGGFIKDIRVFGKLGFKGGLENMFKENKGKPVDKHTLEDCKECDIEEDCIHSKLREK